MFLYSSKYLSWIAIVTVGWLEILVLLFIKGDKPDLRSGSTCECGEISNPNSGGLPSSANALDIVRWHQWNNIVACKDLRFFGGWIWRTQNDEKMDGHKAVCFDDGVRPIPGNCLVYSFGVKNDWSFETAMVEYGCEVHGFDPSIDEPKQTAEKKFTWHKIGLQGKDGTNTNGWEMLSLRSIMTKLGHQERRIDVLKMDIEESEYEAIPNIITSGLTNQIKQIALETHNYWMNEEQRASYHWKYQQIWKLEKHGFVRFSSQPAMKTDRINNIANMSDFYCYELAWYNPMFYTGP